MEFIDSQHGVTVLLASIVIVLCFQFIAKIGEIIWDVFRKKGEMSEKIITEMSMALRANTEAVRELRVQLSVIDQELTEMKKFKVDARRLFAAVKVIAGPKWAEVRKAMEEDDIPR